jgi:rubrerythrin
MAPPDLLGFLFETDETHIYECRACGTTVDEATEMCPNCGRTEIAEIRLR